MLYKIFLFALIICFLNSCKQNHTKEDKGETNKDSISLSSDKDQPKKEISKEVIRKYGIKSAKITFTTQIADVEGLRILYFDNYGKDECEEIYEKGKLTESTLSFNNFMYKIIHKDKSAYKLGPTRTGVAYKFDWQQLPDKLKKEGRVIKTQNKEVAGKICEAYKMENAGIVTEFAGWNNICLFTEQKTKQGNSFSKAIKIEENIKIEPEKFSLSKDLMVK